jgi:sRNA-binding protein
VGPDDVDGGPDQAGPVGGDWDGAPLGEAQRAAVLARQVARQAAREAAREAARRELAAAAEARQAARRTPDAARRRTEPDTPILRSVGDGGAGSNR